ncbi:MAG: ribonuclease P protein component [Candidatus Gracilibacteria bacterium]
MISKDYRLKENEVKKVLKYGKPFFSYGLVLNYTKNNLKHNRFAIIISGKNVDSSVKRNFFRRRFYDMVNVEMGKGQNPQTYHDLVFVLKKQTKLEKNNLESINGFDNDVKFLLKKMMNIKG